MARILRRTLAATLLWGAMMIPVAAQSAAPADNDAPIRKQKAHAIAKPAVTGDCDDDGVPQRANARDLVGAVRGEEDADHGPLAREVEKYRNRAYPAASIPLSITLNSQKTFKNVKARGQSKSNRGKQTPLTWLSLGPTQAIFPSVLTFTGAQYVTSGRVTALAISPTCSHSHCRVWAAAAGGGIWRTDNGLSGSPNWTFISGGLSSNAIGAMTLDPTDSTGNTLYVGTGEPNVSVDSEAGLGVYKSTDGGDTFTLMPGTAFAEGFSISDIVIDPTNANTIYVATAVGLRGLSAVEGGEGLSIESNLLPVGLYKSTNGGTSFSPIWVNPGSGLGITHAELDPNDHTRIYASAFDAGIWRSTGGGPFEQVFAAGDPGTTGVDNTAFALTVKNGHTRIYAGDGDVGAANGVPPSLFWRVDNADVAAAALTTGGSNVGWQLLTSASTADPHYPTFDYCTGQCWYDNRVYTPKGRPDTVYVLGSYTYGELGGRSNARAVLRSTTAGDPDPNNNNRTFTDMTNDATSDTAPNGLHPDEHALVFMPGNPDVWFEGSDGGVMRSSGAYTDVSYRCDTRGLSVNSTLACHRMLSSVPTTLFNLNRGLNTLQFQSLSVNPLNPKGEIQGGTQDNGTWLYSGSSVVWNQTIYGDGGQSGFNRTNPAIRFNNFTGGATDSNFRSGDPSFWVITSGPLLQSHEAASFYIPMIADPNPASAGSMFAGFANVWRTTDNGGSQAFLEANCPEFTQSSSAPFCGDWEPLGTVQPAPGGRTVAAISRSTTDTGTAWVGVNTGRILVSHNVDAVPASATTFTRIDTLSGGTAPLRFPTSIIVDPSNSNHAWISYDSYNAFTPTTPGHVFSVVYNPIAGTAVWTDLDGGTGPLGDLPVTALARDGNTGDLYAGTDFAVLRLPFGSSTWALAGSGMPIVEIDDLELVSSARKLYAGTHGRGAWSMQLP